MSGFFWKPEESAVGHFYFYATIFLKRDKLIAMSEPTSVVGTKRRSRFESVKEDEPEPKKIAIDVTAAAARAAEISRELANKVKSMLCSS